MRQCRLLPLEGSIGTHFMSTRNIICTIKIVVSAMQVSGLVENPYCLLQSDHPEAKVCLHVWTIYVHHNWRVVFRLLE